MSISELLDPFEKLLELAVWPYIRSIESGGPWRAAWDEISNSGFLDALVPEAAGGAGLTLDDVAVLLHAIGRFAVPLPIGETLAVRAIVPAGFAKDDDVVVLVSPVATGAGLLQRAVPCGAIATHALVDLGDRLVYTDLAGARRHPVQLHSSISSDIHWDTVPAGPEFPRPAEGLWPLGAVLRAALIAGVADRLLETTVDYANERTQFGKPIGRQQVIQQQLAVMAEKAVSARVASRIGCLSGLAPSTVSAAIAKLGTSAASVEVAAIAHAVHGAIGLSEELDLPLFTRRLYEWRIADGSEGYWARKLGAARMAHAGVPSSEFIRKFV